MNKGELMIEEHNSLDDCDLEEILDISTIDASSFDVMT